MIADESDTRVFLFNLLSSVGFEPVGVCNMSEGLKIAKSRMPALIILDVMMSDKKGILMYHYLKNDAILKTVPVIMLSAIDRETFFLYEKFHSPFNTKGVPEPDGYLEKPPEADDLIRMVHSLIAPGREKQDDVTIAKAPETA